MTMESRSSSPRNRLSMLLDRDENSLCADCNEPEPTWASTNLGVFICTQCAGVHRSLGVEHSFILSCTLDNWTDSQVHFMEDKGNKKVNDFLEFCVPKNIEVPCLSFTDRDTREKYIKAKYITKLFCDNSGRTPRPPERVVRKASPPAVRNDRSHSAMVEYIGIVHVHVLECRDLIIKDILTSDPYCVLSIGKQVNKTKTQYKTLAPRYDEHFTFSWDGCDVLKVEIYDKDELTKDDHMGMARIDLSPLLRECDSVVEDWFPIMHRKKEEKRQGDIRLSVTFMQIK